MALNREQILAAEITNEEEYLVELMQLKHNAAVTVKRLDLALDANDQLHARVAELEAAGADAAEPPVEGEVLRHQS